MANLAYNLKRADAGVAKALERLAKDFSKSVRWHVAHRLAVLEAPAPALMWRLFDRMIRKGAVAYPEPDLSNMGGITAWLRVAHLAQASHLPVTSHGVHDLHVHLLAAVPNASFMEVHGFGLERFQRLLLAFENGDAIATDRPGHGVELLWDALEPNEVKGC
ncbi:MAG: enolase C-terminal domain-like protein [Eubacteriales bacterium]